MTETTLVIGNVPEVLYHEFKLAYNRGGDKRAYRRLRAAQAEKFLIQAISSDLDSTLQAFKICDRSRDIVEIIIEQELMDELFADPLLMAKYYFGENNQVFPLLTDYQIARSGTLISI